MAEDLMGKRLPLVLRLLDHQIVGVDGELVGNVDDLVVHESESGIVVTALLSGPPALARRQGGRGGRWLDAVWRRLHPDRDPLPTAVPLDEVTRLDSAVHVSRLGESVLAASQGFELWLRDHVVSRLPGATGGETTRPSVDEDLRQRPPFVLLPGEHTLSELLGAPVRSAGDRLGELVEVIADPLSPSSARLGALVVRELVCSPRHLGEELGYTLEPQGPAVLRRLLRAWHDRDRLVDARDVRITWDPAGVEVRRGATLRHPHDQPG
jgi:hypothetical protein